ncbi:MtnX-like HAD-IB family phosphatase [Rickettsiales bacterium LUAb2]
MITIFSDFDGTITKKDTTDLILNEFADPKWLEIEELYNKNLISSKDCLAEQIKLINANFNDIKTFLDKNIEIEEDFSNFIHRCKQLNIRVVIVSDGLDLVIQHILNKHNLQNIEVFSNKLQILENNSYSLEFPNFDNNCEIQMGNCKCNIISKLNTNDNIIYIGDSRSDFCVSKNKAKTIIAKDKLITYCQQNNIKYIPFTNFNNVINIL